MELLYGKNVAKEITDQLKVDIFSRDKKPGLAVILIGENAASEIYVALKEKKAREIGMHFFCFNFPQTVSQDEIIEKIISLNNDESICGIIVQLPLPESFDTKKIITSIAIEKDVDGFHPENAQLFLNSRETIVPVFPQAIMCLIESSKEILENKKAVVLANSIEFGEIMTTMLNRKMIASKYILASDFTTNLKAIKDADIVVTAMGSPELLKGSMLKDGAIIIDGGIEKIGARVVGDVDFSSTKALNGYITPVPGGVGPVTIACLLKNVFLAFKAQQKEK
jgi:methylenetetrahydrofolate dehydrogenase (NADP+)/methenyltetrahydrofolate cyclohydrolase